MNHITLMGNITRDIEVRQTQSGTAVCEMGLAINEAWTKDGTKHEKTVFVDCTLWGRTAEIAGEYLTKGRKVLIEGKLDLDQWEDKQTGQKRQKLKVTVTRLHLLPNGQGRQSARGEESQDTDYRPEPQRQETEPAWKATDEDEVPF